jgi:hypothetical protein
MPVDTDWFNLEAFSLSTEKKLIKKISCDRGVLK